MKIEIREKRVSIFSQIFLRLLKQGIGDTVTISITETDQTAVIALAGSADLRDARG